MTKSHVYILIGMFLSEPAISSDSNLQLFYSTRQQKEIEERVESKNKKLIRKQVKAKIFKNKDLIWKFIQIEEKDEH